MNVVSLSRELEIDVNVNDGLIVRTRNVILERRRCEELDAVVDGLRTRVVALRHRAEHLLEQALDGAGLNFRRNWCRPEEEPEVDVLDSGEADGGSDAGTLGELPHFSVAETFSQLGEIPNGQKMLLVVALEQKCHNDFHRTAKAGLFFALEQLY